MNNILPPNRFSWTLYILRSHEKRLSLMRFYEHTQCFPHISFYLAPKILNQLFRLFLLMTKKRFSQLSSTDLLYLVRRVFYLYSMTLQVKDQYCYYEPVQLFSWLSNSFNLCTNFVYFQLLQLLCKNLIIIYYTFKGKLWKFWEGKARRGLW